MVQPQQVTPQAGKGSKPRPMDRKRYDANWEEIRWRRSTSRSQQGAVPFRKRACPVACVLFLFIGQTAHASWLRPSPTYQKAADHEAGQLRAEIRQIADARIDARVPGLVRAGIEDWLRERGEYIEWILKVLGLSGLAGGGLAGGLQIGKRRERRKNGNEKGGEQ